MVPADLRSAAWCPELPATRVDAVVVAAVELRDSFSARAAAQVVSAAKAEREALAAVEEEGVPEGVEDWVVKP
jgi:hypothetical protein